MAKPTVRVSTGKFSPERYTAIRQLIEDSAAALSPAIGGLPGLLYYHAGVDAETNTVVSVSVWENTAAARPISTLPAMRAQRRLLERAGVVFDAIAHYEPAWTIEKAWATPVEEFNDPNDSALLRDKLKGQTTVHASPPRLEDEGQAGG